MRQPSSGIRSDQANDSWLDFPDADRFGPLHEDTNYPEGFIKVFGNAQDGEFEYTGRADIDHRRTEVAVEFSQPGTYEMQIAGRSHGQELDQIILFGEDLDAEFAASGCNM